jgi:RNA polymerase-binding transcription factor DksA
MDTASVTDLLLRERATTLAQQEQLRRDLDEIIAAAADVATDDEHDPEGPTIAYERARIQALLDQSKAHLDEIGTAFARLEAGSYDSCDRCGAEIGVERLRARPAVRTCIACASG